MTKHFFYHHQLLWICKFCRFELLKQHSCGVFIKSVDFNKLSISYFFRFQLEGSIKSLQVNFKIIWNCNDKLTLWRHYKPNNQNQTTKTKNKPSNHQEQKTSSKHKAFLITIFHNSTFKKMKLVKRNFFIKTISIKQNSVK